MSKVETETLTTTTTASTKPVLKNGPQDGIQYPLKVLYCGGLFLYLIIN